MLPDRAEHPQLYGGAITVDTLGMMRGRWKTSDLFRYAKTVRAYHPDIVHSHMIHATLLARLGRPLVGTPLVCTAHNIVEGPEHAQTAPLRTRLREIAYRLSDPLCELTTQVSAEGARRYVAIGATPASKMKYVPNAIDCERFRPEAELRRRPRGVGAPRRFCLDVDRPYGAAERPPDTPESVPDRGSLCDSLRSGGRRLRFVGEGGSRGGASVGHRL